MTGFDFAVIAILLVSLLFGLWRGLLYEVLSLLGWPLAFILSNVEGKQEMLRTTGAYALVFIAVMIVWGVLVWALCKLLRAIGLGRLDRMLGGLFGVFRCVLGGRAVGGWAGGRDIPERPLPGAQLISGQLIFWDEKSCAAFLE